MITIPAEEFVDCLIGGWDHPVRRAACNGALQAWDVYEPLAPFKIPYLRSSITCRGAHGMTPRIYSTGFRVMHTPLTRHDRD